MSISFDIILPYFNERNSAIFTLNCLLKLIQKPNNIFFINSASTDDTSMIIENFIEKNNLTNWFNVNTNLKTPSEAKNLGVIKSLSEWCAFMDFDLFFDKSWTDKQIKIIEKNKNINIVFGVINLNPSNYIDKLTIIQTYGIGSLSPIIPSSFIKREYLIKNGMFKPYRSFYDRYFINQMLKRSNEHIINYDVKISYLGYSYASNLKTIFLKVVNYSIQSLYFSSYLTPYIYFFAWVFLTVTFFLSIKIFYISNIIYFISRAILIPILKNKNYFNFLIRNIIQIFLIGLLIDISKSIGFILGFISRLINKKIRIDKFYK